MSHRHLLSLICIAALALLTSCSSGGDDSETVDNSGGETPTAAGARDLPTDCGVVQSGSVSNPLDASAGEAVTISSVVDATHLVIQRAAGAQLVKLHGVMPPALGASAAVAVLNRLAAEPAIFFEVGDACDITGPGGGQGIAGYLFTQSGRSYIEELIKAGVALTVQADDVCSSGLISGCYTALQETHRPKTMGQINDFLWKPKAESAYNHGSLVIHAGPCNATVRVNGEALLDFGPANGRCNTSRAFKPGCAFGNNVTVEVIDNDSGLPYTHDGQPFIIVPRGCDRFEFKR